MLLLYIFVVVMIFQVWEAMQEQFLAGYATEAECEEITLSTFKATGKKQQPFLNLYTAHNSASLSQGPEAEWNITEVESLLLFRIVSLISPWSLPVPL